MLFEFFPLFAKPTVKLSSVMTFKRKSFTTLQGMDDKQPAQP